MEERTVTKWAAIISVLLSAAALAQAAAARLDLAPFGKLTEWRDAGPLRLKNIQQSAGKTNAGIEWDEERDVAQVRIHFAHEAAHGARVEYWFRTWPSEPPKMPSMEDPLDDAWQGNWLTAATTEHCVGSVCEYEFQPLSTSENPLAAHLPGVRYRRALKVRIVFPDSMPELAALQVFSETVEAARQIRVEFSGSANLTGSASIYNGQLISVKPWQFSAEDTMQDSDSWSLSAGSARKGVVLDLISARPSLPGSNDETVATIHLAEHSGATTQDRTFSFAVADLNSGPIVLPWFGVRIENATDPEKPNPRAGREKIRKRLLHEPEQTYERASSEIPPLDPWDREGGGRAYFPLAADSNWQKFAFEYGGNVYISKSGTKAKGRELARLNWPGDRFTWRIGTGTNAYDRADHRASVSVLDRYLPVVKQTWNNEGFEYSEEAFATLLHGPLSPVGSARDEETPAVLMVRLEAHNPTAAERNALVWLSMNPNGSLSVENNTVKLNGRIRAQVERQAGISVTMAPQPETTGEQAVKIAVTIPAGGSKSVVLKLPFVSDLQGPDLGDLARLSYDEQRQRVVAYWKDIVTPAVRFNVPEQRFNDIARAVITHIHISTTKDPNTGLMMVPAASYNYDVFENEAAYQVLLLDTLGQKQTAESYLETMMRLQGSKNFPGLQQGGPDGIFHGARISADYDYTASGYGLDHGTVLWVLAQHYFYTQDRTWLAHAWPHMRKAIRWIEEQRKSTKKFDDRGNKAPEYGMLPASRLEDNSDWANWFVINAYAWAGMARTAEALRDAEMADAAAVQREADAYLADLRSDILRASQASPVARMQDGTFEPFVPIVPKRRFRLFGPMERDYYHRYGHSDINPLLRLGADRDTLCGPVLFLLLGVFGPNEPIANWILDDWEDNLTLSSGMGMNIHGMTDDRYWFSQGGMVFQANLVNPIQIYLRRHEPKAAIRNLYNDFVACLYPDANMFTEEYHQWRHGSGPFYKIPDEARFVNRIRDLLVIEDEDTLWLAPGTPRRWLAAKEGVKVQGVQTFFGPISYTIDPGAKQRELKATVQLPAPNRAKQTWLVVRVPEGTIQSVTLDGQPWNKLDLAREAIELPAKQGTMHLTIQYGADSKNSAEKAANRREPK